VNKINSLLQKRPGFADKMKKRLPYFLLSLLFSGVLQKGTAQDSLSLWEPSPVFHAKRFAASTAVAGATYAGSMVALSQAWYAGFERTSFQFFDDRGEWADMDKAGHVYASFLLSDWAFRWLRWTGVEHNKAVWYGAGTAMLFQTTIELLDAHSAKWGFSAADMGANIVGAGVFVLQEFAWKDQRFRFKFSSSPSVYPDYLVLSEEMTAGMPLEKRGDLLFGRSFPERVLKDYNAQTIWLSANLHSLLGRPSFLPAWLNLALGYGASNMYGGFENRWNYEGNTYQLSPESFPRYQQFYLSLDVDLDRVPVRSPFLRTVLGVLNAVKIPAPALEYNRLGRWRLHPLYF
jgi:hypothetical protein